MGASVDSGPIGKNRRSTEIDLNIAPIIDCLVVLIAFMLASAAYLSIGILDAGVAAAGPTEESAKPPSVNIDVYLSSKKEIKITLEGKSSKVVKIEALNNELDLERFKEEMSKLQKQFPDSRALTLRAHDDIPYKEIIVTMSSARKNHPAVLLGGF